MTLERRLLLFGALVPTVLMAVGFLSTGLLLERQLLDATDRALLSQAAVESVSLFDSPDGRPHMHLSRSPLGEAVSGFAPRAVLFDASGTAVARFDAEGFAPARLTPRESSHAPEPTTRVVGERRVREVRVSVAAPDGKNYALWVGVSLEPEARTLRTYARTAATVLLAASFLFFLLQRREAARLGQRLGGLAAHATRLREGRFDAPAPDDVGDVVSALRDAFASATERLRSAQEAEKRLVADAAHELRTPLTAMRAVIDTTLRRERTTEELRDALQHTRAEVDRLASLATELLDLAAVRQADGAKDVIDVNALVGDAIEGVRSLADEREVEIRASVPDAPLRARVMGAQLRRAVENLVLNALRFAPPKSDVRVAVRDLDGRLEISVEDDGDGVPPAERDAIFEPFRRGVEARGRGAGLGLAIVRDVARRHGGDAWVDASFAGGARFVIDLGPSRPTEGRA